MYVFITKAILDSLTSSNLVQSGKGLRITQIGSEVVCDCFPHRADSITSTILVG